MTGPDKIWAWTFISEKQDDLIKGGWTDIPDGRETEYTRTSAHPVTVEMLELLIKRTLQVNGETWRDDEIVQEIRNELRAAIAAMKEAK